MGPFPEGKGEPTPETEPIFLAGENWRVFEIIILIIRYAFHHGFGDAIAGMLGFGAHATPKVQKLANTLTFSVACPLKSGPIQKTGIRG